MDHIMKDDRFKHLATDPKFRSMPRRERKVKIDKRFQGMFKDKRFMVKSTIDKRGRPINQSSSENLRKYYDLSTDEESDSNDEEQAEIDTKTSVTKQKKTKEEGEDVASEENSSDNDFSSNGELLRVKPTEKSDEDDDTSSQENDESDEDGREDTQDQANDLTENERQLHLREKDEISKIPKKLKEKIQDLSVNYARGEGVLISDSSSDEESSEYEDDDEIEHNWGELDKEADTTDEITHRLALCNMDWDRIRALDLMVLFNSFLPSGGLIKSVAVYPSEFGMQRMKEEEISGPIELTQPNDNDPEEDDDQEEGSEYHMEKLRKYQLNRLKYYYAVIDFDSTETANKVYTECDGIEYESTATKLDLRFIPDDMEFDQEPREVCTDIPELAKYQPRQFTTTALQQVKVELTWDETNPERQEFAQKVNSGKLDEINESDLQAYLGSETSDSEPEPEKKKDQNSDDSESETADPIAKYKSLLKEIEDQEEAKQNKEVELEFTWGLGTEEKAEKLVKERLKKNENLTPFEQYLEKRKSKQKAKREERKKLRNDAENDNENSDVSESEEEGGSKMKKKDGKSSKRKNSSMGNKASASDDEDEEHRKAELELLLMDENDAESKRHFNMKKIEETATMSKSKQKRMNKKKVAGEEQPVDDFEVDVKDPRFNALFTSHHYNIDPADSHYRKTKGTEALVKEKLKRRIDDNTNEAVKPKQQKKDKKLNVELQALVKSVKRNTQNITRPIKR